MLAVAVVVAAAAASAKAAPGRDQRVGSALVLDAAEEVSVTGSNLDDHEEGDHQAASAVPD